MHMNSDWSIIEHACARNMKDLATELDMPQLLYVLRRFLQSQLQDDDHHPEDVPLDECPFYDGFICVYNSTSSTFYAPSDVSGLLSRPCPTLDSYPVTLVASQLYSSTPDLCASLRSRMCTYPSAKCDPLH